MSRSLITLRLRSARYEHVLESLERRQVMAVASSPVAAATGLLDKISVAPGDGQVFTMDSAPHQIVVSVDQAELAGWPLSTWWRDGTIRLEQVGLDGTTTTIDDSLNPPTAVLDNAAGTATIPITSPLQPGRYQIVLSGDSALSQQLSVPSSASSTDQTLAQFEVVGTPATLRTAADLGTLGSSILTALGSLDLQGQSVALYKITLGVEQPLWRLGVQVDAQAIGSPLRSALTLFDQQGHAIASRSAGSGLGSTIDDPYLFAALKPGVYYVGISGAGNLGGQPGGYDPTTGAPGISTTDKDVGPFQLQVVADPLTTPMRVVGFSLDHADATSASPTGFTISFSEALDPDSLSRTPFYVQNQQGQTFPVIFNSVGSRLNQVEFLFDRLLAPGVYRLIVPEGGGLTDLVGRSPINPKLPAGTLAIWMVQPTKASSNGDAPISLTFSPSDDAHLSAEGKGVVPGGGQVTFRLVVPPVSGGVLKTTFSTNMFRVEELGADGAVVINGTKLDPSVPDPINGIHYGYSFSLTLVKGVYLLRLTATGSEDLTFDWKLTVTPGDVFLANAVGASGALSLRMGGSTSTGFPEAPFGAASPGLLASAPGPGAITTLPSSYSVTVGSTLVGRPSGGNDAISAVGSSVSGGLVAMANAGRGLAPGILSSAGYGDDGRLRDAEGLVLMKAANDPVAARPGPRTSDEELHRAGDEKRGDEADALALLEADRLANAARRVGWWLFGGPEDDQGVISTEDRLDSATLASVSAGAAEQRRDLRVDLERSGEVERATLGAPVSLVVAAAAAFRFRQLARKWWRKSGPQTATSKAAQSPLWRGPRYMVPPSRRMNRARNVHHV